MKLTALREAELSTAAAEAVCGVNRQHAAAVKRIGLGLW